MEFIAHRGASFDAPENTLEAIERAIAQGADRIEIDLHMTADGVAVVSHDGTTQREGDRAFDIHAVTLDTLRTVQLPNGEPPPTFDEVCALVAGRAELDVELKSGGSRVVEAALEGLRAHGLYERALITSFDHDLVREARRQEYRGELGLLVGERSKRPSVWAYQLNPVSAVVDTGASCLVVHHALAVPWVRLALRRHGLGLYVWLAMEDEQRDPVTRRGYYRRAARLAPRGLIIGRVVEARAALHQTAPPPEDAA